MHIERFAPGEILKPFIRQYVFVETTGNVINRILPDTSLVMAIRYSGNINDVTGLNTNQLPSSLITGLKKSPRLINYGSATGNMLILFKAAGAAAFFKQPLHELFEASVPLDNFITPDKLNLLEEQLAEADGNQQRAIIADQFLIQQIQNHKQDQLVISALQKIRLSKGQIRIRELADAHYISQDAFEKRFRRVVGTSPKQFASIIKIKSIVDSKVPDASLTQTALDAGYFDQPHFNKEFKLFTGLSPADFFKVPRAW
ncbi:helix-turn-helix domain-containing protein [Mucilaginibacter kameinonensis]|uniref:helix-turn-helix domain-containing protein n=1 Tax=Mucilaginibacter kameinonensis TaxID=452286 RepID=UPI000EF7A567|nr:helix-turn-helix transcriptional regulator [Mucilaginibacter kameinonensis]